MTFSVPAPSPVSPRGAALKLAASRLVWSLLLPAVGAALVMRTLVPSPLEGSSGGGVAAIARFADEHPLIIGLLLFIAISEALRYWRVRLGFGERGAAAPAGRALSLRMGRGVAGAVGVVLAVLVVRSSFVQTYRVVSPSMVPTLDSGDTVLVNKVAYGLRLPFTDHPLGGGTLPRRGDVVVFRASAVAGVAATAGPSGRVVKRVLGLPGDRVSMQEGRLTINGWQVPSCDAGPYASVAGRLTVRGRVGVEVLEGRAYLTVWTPGEAPFAGFTVPPGQVFVVGDDRGMSNDSRLWNDRRGGGVPIDAIEGRVSRILVGSRRDDGRLDLSRLNAPLGLQLRQPGVDVKKLEDRIAGCLKSPPKISEPPAAASQ